MRAFEKLVPVLLLDSNTLTPTSFLMIFSISMTTIIILYGLQATAHVWELYKQAGSNLGSFIKEIGF
jgi:hypothetical protein